MIYEVHRSKIITIGEIDFSDALMEDQQIEPNKNHRLNLPGGIGQCTVTINDIEGPIPHVHVTTKDKKWGTCICLHDAYYFPHGGNPLTEGVFNSKQSKMFNKWMSEGTTAFTGASNFTYAAFLWMKNFESQYGDIYKRNNIALSIQPDYSHMRGDVNPNLR